MILGFDIETNGLSPYKAGSRILTAAACSDRSCAGWLKPKAIPVLNNPKNTIVGHNITGFDVAWWEHHTGQRIAAKWFDTKVAYALIDENAKHNSLEFLAEKYTTLKKNEDNLDRRKLEEADPELVLKYNIQDAKISLALYAPLKAELDAQGLTPLFAWLMGVSRHLVDMSVTGTYIDAAWVDEQGAAISKEFAETAAQLHEFIGREINLGSPKQLTKLLYEDFGMPVVEKTKKGQPSTGADALMALRHKARSKKVRTFLDLLLKHRELAKLEGTYLRPLKDKHLGRDGRVHTTFHVSRGEAYAGMAGTVTGRLSSSDPNLQNIPRDTRVKGAFAATPGLKMFTADYSQLEIRVAAWYSGEPTMLKAFASGQDVHTATLAEMEGRSYEDVMALLKAEDKEWVEKRALIKRINFGVLYGVQAYRLTKLMRDMDIHIPVWRAEEIIEQWFAKYRRMAAWIEETKARAVSDRQLVTPTGRVRHLPDAEWGTPWGERALRQGVNFMVQSLASDVALAAIAELGSTFTVNGGAQLVLTVHDSVVGEYHPADWAETELKALLTEKMTRSALRNLEVLTKRPLDIPLEIDVKLGQERWLK